MAINTNAKTPKDILAPIVAFLALVGFALFIHYMLGLTRAQETEWTRAVYLFTGVEAIAFAAAGFFFGREVQRVRAEKAEKRAEDAEKHAIDAEREVAKGRSLSEAIKAKAAGQLKRAEPYRALGGDKTIELTQADINELADLASRLFP